jgi:hypothetical protein
LACKLSGSNLYLVNSVSNDPQFDHPVQVPDGFPGYALPVPHPTNGQLYVKLRDDPSVINPATVGTRQLPPSSNEAERGLAKPAASNAEHQTGGNFGGKEPAATGGSSQNSPAQPVPSSQAAPAQAAQLQQTGPKSIPQNEAATHGADPPGAPDQQK